LPSLALSLLAGCSGTPQPNCVRLPGCPSEPICCAAEQLCARRICEGVEWTCRTSGDGAFGWGRTPCPGDSRVDLPRDVRSPDKPGADTLPPDGKSCACAAGSSKPCGLCNLGKQQCAADCSGYEPDCKGVPPDACQPGGSRPCGNCGGGTQGCNGSCAWDACQGEPCLPGSTTPCPNGCGTRACSATCSWGDCSLKGQPVTKGPLCWSDNHCGTGNGRCVACWQLCDANGNLYTDGWCAGSCTTCSPEDPSC